MNKIFNKILNFKLFDTKLGEKNNNLNFAHKIPAVLGKTKYSKWCYDNKNKINIFHYWWILWINGISMYHNGERTQIIQKSYISLIFNWVGKRFTYLIDNSKNFIYLFYIILFIYIIYCYVYD